MFAWRRTFQNRKVLISTKTGRGIRGVYVAKRGSFVILKGADFLDERGTSTQLDGDVVVERVNIDFVQILPEV